MLPVSALNTIVYTQLSCPVPKEIVEKFNFSEFEIENVKLFTQSPIPKFFPLTFLTLEVA